jgi:hypothetical protein
MKLSVSFQLLDLGQSAVILGRVICSSQAYFPYFDKIKSSRYHLAVCAPHPNTARRQLSVHIPTTTGELLDVAFSMLSVSFQIIYSETKAGDKFFSELLVL